MRIQRREAAGDARRDVDQRKGEMSDEPLEDEAELHEDRHVHEQREHAGMDERPRHETPPFAVRRARSEIRAPRHERCGIADRPVARRLADEDRHRDDREGRRHDRPARPRAERVVERIALRDSLRGGV